MDWIMTVWDAISVSFTNWGPSQNSANLLQAVAIACILCYLN